MLKPGLGKGLGDLMKGDQVAGKENIRRAAPLANANIGRGLQTLVQPHAAAPVPSQSKRILPPWFYFAADLLLLAFTVGVCFDATRPYDFGTILFCAISITTGALLAIVGIRQVAVDADHQRVRTETTFDTFDPAELTDRTR